MGSQLAIVRVFHFVGICQSWSLFVVVEPQAQTPSLGNSYLRLLSVLTEIFGFVIRSRIFWIRFAASSLQCARSATTLCALRSMQILLTTFRIGDTTHSFLPSVSHLRFYRAVPRSRTKLGLSDWLKEEWATYFSDLGRKVRAAKGLLLLLFSTS